MKKYLNKIKIHPIFIIVVFVFTLIGRFEFILYYTLLILIHEIGHITISIIFKWNVESVVILPFGGLIKFRELINKPLIEEFLICISGIIFQFIFYILIKDYISYNYFSLINYFIIIFNLIPIYPLDGSKIINVFLNYITSFYNSLNITITLSYIFINLITLYFFDVNRIVYIVLFFLIKEVNKLNKDKKNIFNKFLLERYLNNFNFKKRKIIKNIKNMKKDYKHLFLNNNTYKTEREILKKMFDNKEIL